MALYHDHETTLKVLNNKLFIFNVVTIRIFWYIIENNSQGNNVQKWENYSLSS